MFQTRSFLNWSEVDRRVMKKILVFLSILINTNCYAATISISPFISGNDVTISHLETQRQTIQNWANGSVEGGAQNIRQGSVTSYDLATAINPVTFRNEAFNDWTYSGMLAPTSGSLSSTTTAGISYVNGVRVETSATAHTYTASKDTYVYINAGGFFEYSEVSNGASAPATPANDLLLFKVVTSGSAVTSVSDLRTTSIQITANSSNFATDYRNQCFLSNDSTTTFHSEPGDLAIGNANYSRTAVTTTKTISTGTNWIEGSYPTGMIGNIFVYAYNDSGTSWDFKFSSADVVYSSSSGNTAGTLRYYTSGGTTYRAIGWMYLSADAVQSYNVSNFNDISTWNYIQRVSNTTDTINDTSYGTDLTETNVNFYASGKRPVQVIAQISSNADMNNGFQIVLNVDGVDNLDSQTGSTGPATDPNSCYTNVTLVNVTRGSHIFKIRAKVSASTDTINKKVIMVKEL